MVDLETITTGYLDTLLLYYEEEIMGEAYFYALAQTFNGPGEPVKLTLMAEVERHAAEAVRPLLQKHGLVPRQDCELVPLGENWAKRHGGWSWGDLMKDISVCYPDYVDAFEKLEKMAPGEDLPALKVLTEHEVAAIEFANREIAGELDSAEPIRRYLGLP